MRATFTESPVQGRLLLGGEEREDLPPQGRSIIAELPVWQRPETDGFYWSASRLRRILQCPRQFRFVYVDRLKTVPSAPMVLGRILHEIICGAHAVQMETGGLPPADDLLSDFDKVWPKVVENIELRYPKAGPDKEEYHGLGREMLRVFRNVACLNEPPLAVELAFEIEVAILVKGEPRDVKLRGVIDRLDEVTMESGCPGIIIVDYKSSRKKLNIGDVEEEIQLTVYALAVQQLLDLPVAQVELLSLRDGETVSAQRRQPQIDWMVKQVLPYAQETLDTGSFRPCPGYWCRWCDFQVQCEAEGLAGFGAQKNGGELNGAAG